MPGMPQPGMPAMPGQPGFIDTMAPTTKVPAGLVHGMPGMAVRTPSYTPPPVLPMGQPMQGPSITSMPPPQNQGPEFVNVNGQQIPIMPDGLLRTWPPPRLREHAAWLHRSLGQERIGMTPPQFDHDLLGWIVH